MKFIKSIAPIIGLILLSFWAVKPLLIPGFFPIHDDTQIARVFEMTKSLKEGMFPVRWVADLGYGYGYPIFNFYAPLSYYIGSVFMLIGFDALLATKIMMGLGIILSALFMYLLAKEFWGNLGAVVSALFYLYAPFHAVDIYVRGDVAEFWAYAFIPLMFWGFYKVFSAKEKFKWVAIASVGYAGIILSHNLTAMMVSPFLLVVLAVFIYKKHDKKTSVMLLSSLVLGLSLSAFYFIPALLEQKYTNVLSQVGGGAYFEDHFVCALQFWQSHWGFGGSATGCFDGLSFMMGKLHIIVSVVAVVLMVALLFAKKTSRLDKRIIVIVLCIAGLLASIFLMLSISALIWKTFPLMAFFQYPWRFLIMTSFFSSVLAGSIVWFTGKIIGNSKMEYFIAAILTLAIIINSIKFFAPQTIFNKTAWDYTNESFIKWNTSKISDEYMPKDFPKPPIEKDIVNERVVFNKEELTVKNKYEDVKSVKLDVEAKQQTKLHFNIAYFPSWKIYVDSSPKGGIVSRGYDILLPKGSHIVEMRFEETEIEKISNLISFAGLVVIIVGIILLKKRVVDE